MGRLAARIPLLLPRLQITGRVFLKLVFAILGAETVPLSIIRAPDIPFLYLHTAYRTFNFHIDHLL